MSNMGDYSREESIFGFTGPVARVAAAAILLVAISVVLFSLPEKSAEWIGSREILRKFYLLPILLSAMWFGARGAVSATVFATLVCGGLAGNDWPVDVSSQIARRNETPLLFVSPPVPSSYQVASVLSPRP